MFSNNKEIYNYYIEYRNKYIINNYKSVTNIEDYLKNETVDKKIMRFFIGMNFVTNVSFLMDKKYIHVTGLGSYISKESKDVGGYYSRACGILIRYIYEDKLEDPHDLILDDIEEYKKLKLKKLIKKQRDDDLVIYYNGYSLEQYINIFEIKNNEQLITKINSQISDHLNYLGLNLEDL